jgi:hypothetical protein
MSRDRCYLYHKCSIRNNDLMGLIWRLATTLVQNLKQSKSARPDTQLLKCFLFENLGSTRYSIIDDLMVNE